MDEENRKFYLPLIDKNHYKSHVLEVEIEENNRDIDILLVPEKYRYCKVCGSYKEASDEIARHYRKEYRAEIQDISSKIYKSEIDASLLSQKDDEFTKARYRKLRTFINSLIDKRKFLLSAEMTRYPLIARRK